MYPFDRFGEDAKKVLAFAQEEAERANHPYIGTEHILLGVLRVTALATQANEKGLAPEDISKAVYEIAAIVDGPLSRRPTQKMPSQTQAPTAAHQARGANIAPGRAGRL